MSRNCTANRICAPPGFAWRSVRVRSERPTTTKRSQAMASKGILGRKLGMTQVWDAENRVVPVTVIEAGPCRVVQLKTPERDGYAAVQLSFGETKPRRLSKPELGHLKAAGGPPSRHLAELRVNDLAGFEIGQIVRADRLRRRRSRRRHRHQQGQGLHRRDAAPQLQGARRVARYAQEAPCRPVRSAPAPRRHACSRA